MNEYRGRRKIRKKGILRLFAAAMCLCLLFTAYPVMPERLLAAQAVSASQTWSDSVGGSDGIAIEGGSKEAPVVITVSGDVEVTGTVTVASGYVKFTGGGALQWQQNATNALVKNAFVVKDGADVVFENVTLQGAADLIFERSALLIRGTATFGSGTTIKSFQSATRSGTAEGSKGVIAVYEQGVLTILDGATITGNLSESGIIALYQEDQVAGSGQTAISTARVNMLGGSITGNMVTNGTLGVIWNWCGNLSISGGSIVAGGEEYAVQTQGNHGGYNATTVISGGSFTGMSKGAVCAGKDLKNNSLILITGGTFEGKTAATVNYGEIRIEGGSYNGTEYALASEGAGALTVSGGEFYGGTGAYSGSITTTADTVLVGENKNSAADWDRTTSLNSYKYVAIGSLDAPEDTNAAFGFDWTLDEEGRLTIRSDAGMRDWKQNGRTGNKDRVRTAEIAEGVTGIADAALSECTALESVAIPEGVAGIGERAFYGCTALREVTIPSDVESVIGDEAFAGCTGLEKVTVEDTYWVPVLGNNVFSDCKFVQENKRGIHVYYGTLGQYKSTWTQWKNYLTDGNPASDALEADEAVCYVTLKLYGRDKTAEGDYFDSISVQYMSEYKPTIERTETEQDGCTEISLKIALTGVAAVFTGSSVLDRGGKKWIWVSFAAGSAREQEHALYAVKYMDGAQVLAMDYKVSDYAFEKMADPVKEGYRFNGWVTEDGGSDPADFKNISAPMTVYASWTKDGGAVPSSGWELSADGELTVYTDAGMADWIENGRADKNAQVKSVEIKDAVTSIGQSAFMGCRSLTEVTIPRNVTSIGGQAFADCESLQKVNVERVETVPAVGNDTFANCGFVKAVPPIKGIHVPEGKEADYKAGWTAWADYIADDSQTEPEGPAEAEKVAAAKSVVEKAVEDLSVTNAATKEDIQSAIDAALADAGVKSEDVTAEVTDFEKTKATGDAAGSISATVTITSAADAGVTDTVRISIAIPKATADKKVEADGNVPSVELPAAVEELAQSILTESELKQKEEGTDVLILLTVKDAQESVSDEDKAAVKQALSGGGAQGFAEGRYMDVSLFKIIGENRNAVSETSKEIEIMITVPDDLKGKTERSFAVVRVHNGETAVLEDLDNNPDTITIKTDRFSTYAIVYKDTTGGNTEEKPTEEESTQEEPTEEESTQEEPTEEESTQEKPTEEESTQEKPTEGDSTGGNPPADNAGDTTHDEPAADTKSPSTGASPTIMICATLSMIMGLTYLLAYFGGRRRGMTENAKKELVSRLIAWAKRGGKFRRLLAAAGIVMLLAYYHAIGKTTDKEWENVY